MSFRRFSRRRGFTLADLLVILVVSALALSAVAMAANVATERDRRIVCANNLRIIGEGLRRYSNENKGNFPRTRYDFETADRPVVFTNPTAKDPFAEDGPGPNDVTAALYLLVRTQHVQPHAFVCPGARGAHPMRFGTRPQPPGGEIDPLAEALQRAAGHPRSEQSIQERQRELKQSEAAIGWPPATAGAPAADNPQALSNFFDPSNLSYSYANPYAGKQGAEDGFKLNYVNSFPIAADINPGGEGPLAVKGTDFPHRSNNVGLADPKSSDAKFTAAMRRANSPNHGGFGQNVLYIGGGVIWQPTPFSGHPRPSEQGATQVDQRDTYDNIYTRHAGKPSQAVAAGLNPKLDGDPIIGPPMYRYDVVLLPVAAAPLDLDGAAAGEKDAAAPPPAPATENPLHRVAPPSGPNRK